MKTSKTKSLVTRIFIATIIVMILTCLTNSLTGLFDGLIISRIFHNTTAKTWCGTAHQFCLGISQLLGLGAQIVVTKYLTAGKRSEANKVFNSIFLLSILVGLFLTIVFICTSKYIVYGLSGCVTDQDKLYSAQMYLCGYAIGITFMILNQILCPIIYLDGGKTIVQITLIVILVINPGLDYLLGKTMFNSMFGVGLASTISTIVPFIIYFTYCLTKSTNIKFKLSFKDFKGAHWKDIFAAGSPMAIKFAAITATVYLYTLIITNVGNIWMQGGGDIAITARGAQATVSGFFESTNGAMLLTTTMLVSVFYSERDLNSLKQLEKNIIKFALFVMVPIAIFYFFMAPIFAEAYLGKSHKAVELTTFAMRCGAVTLLFLWFNSSSLGYYQATKNTKCAWVVTVLQSCVIPVSFMAIFGFAFGVKWMFVGYMLNTMMYTIIHLIATSIRNRGWPKSLDYFYYFDKSFKEQGKEINCSVKNIDDLVRFKDLANKFCVKNKARKQDKEEIIKLIDLQGQMLINKYYLKKNKRGSADFRLIYKDNQLILKSRDNFKQIDIVGDKLPRNNGLRNSVYSINKITGQQEYAYVLKTNNITLTL